MKLREKTALTRWIIFTASTAVLCWGLWSVWGHVPSSNAALPWPFGGYRLPFAVSRWWDPVLAAPFVLGLWGLRRLMGFCERRDRRLVNLSNLQGFSLILSVPCIVGAGIGSGPYNGLWDSGVATLLVMSASFLFLHGLFAGRRWYVVYGSAWYGLASLATIGLLAGPFQGAIWTAFAAVTGAVGYGFGLLCRQLGRPIAFGIEWLSVKGVTDAPSKPEAPRRAEPTDPLSEFDRLTAQLAATQSRLQALRADPEIVKHLALRAERPAA